MPIRVDCGVTRNERTLFTIMHFMLTLLSYQASCKEPVARLFVLSAFVTGIGKLDVRIRNLLQPIT